MIDCINAEVRDALPDLLSGKLSREDAAVLQDHIDGCADCRSELELLREVRATAAIAPPMNISAISSHLPHYAGVTPVPGRQKASVWTWKIAAAAAIITIGVFGVMRDSPSRQATALIPRAVSVVATAKPAPLAAPASAPSQGKVTEAPVKETQVASLAVGGLQDLSDADIEQLLVDLNGMEAMPSAEPQSLSIPIEDSGVEQ